MSGATNNDDRDGRGTPLTPVFLPKKGSGSEGGGSARLPCMHRFRTLLLAFMCVQILVGAGVVYGWPALETTLIDLGVYAESCASAPAAPGSVSAPTHHTCHAQLIKLNTIYVAASWGCQATGVLGFVLDRVGVKYTVVGSSLALGAGALLFALSSGSPDGKGPRPMFNMYLPGLTLMGVAGGGIYLAAQGLGNLFPTSTRRVALFLITGVFAPSMLVFLLFHFLVVEARVTSLRVAFLAYAAVQVFLAIVSFFVWPHQFQSIDEAEAALAIYTPLSRSVTPASVTHSPSPPPAAAVRAHSAGPRSLVGTPHADSRGTAAAAVAPSPDAPTTAAVSASDASSAGSGEVRAPPPMYGSLTPRSSPATAGHPAPPRLITLRDRHAATTSSAFKRLRSNTSLLLPQPSFKSQLLDARFIVQVLMFSVMLLPAQFYIGNLGSQIGRYTSSHDAITDYSRYFNLVYSFVSFATPVLGWVTDKVGFGNTYLVVTALYLAAFASMAFSPSLPFLFVSFTVYTFARNGQFSFFVSYLASTFGPTHLGKLIGIGFLASAMVSLAQAPLLHFVLGALDGNFQYANIAFMASLVLMAPYGAWLLCGAPCCRAGRAPPAGAAATGDAGARQGLLPHTAPVSASAAV